MNQIGYVHRMLIATPHDEIIKPKVFDVTLRDGRTFRIGGGMSASTLKFMRKNGGMLSIKSTVNGEELNVSGKMIKYIQPVPHSQNGDNSK